ncbi:FCD domain-containing protein [Rhizobium lusitanum]|uniref:FCD domain-containing protein n=1 Tax=Rhizobium lusitanum TaxID=293958 RepID=A0A6L9UBB5_9HYPH|nr:FadR/GntR family transcriptional regulator [Rhizobium lusitanum]NEI72581.1 FCD domain-containing protein [Rhizobium lusitanum]
MVNEASPSEDNAETPPDGAAKVIAYVRRRLLAGELKLGDKLPAERELCGLLGISRPSLREGLRALSVLGLLDVQQGRGAFIGRADISVIGDALVFTLAQESNAVEDVLQARIAIEAQAIRIACRVATDQHLAAINEKLEHFVDSLNDPERGGAADHAFHLALVEASQSSTLITMYRAIEPLLLRSHVERRRLAAPDPDVTSYLVQAHKDVFVALVNGDPEEADRRIREHFEISARLRRSRFLKSI